nr:immunoglobulin light chain junction region [Macaca mulatta]
CMQGLEFPNSF